MSEHDAASVVGQMAGVTADGRGAGAGEGAEPAPPSKVIERFCSEKEPEFDEARGVTTHTGFCGFIGQRGTDSMVVGFDDGYDFLGGLTDRGWTPLPAKGDWPLVVYMRWARPGQPHAIAQYCEADLTVWVFASEDAERVFYEELGEQQ